VCTVLPKIQANYAGAADALMLDNEGFVSETNATNVFMVKHGVVYTPHADYCLPGMYSNHFFIFSLTAVSFVDEMPLKLHGIFVCFSTDYSQHLPLFAAKISLQQA